MDPLIVALGSGVLGLLLGSFGNVVIHRVPRDESIVRPPSACPACEAPIRPYDNIPVLSWVILRGRCRDCGAPIAARYPFVELATALLLGLVGYRIGWVPVLPAYLLLAWTLVVISLIDLDTRRIPNRLTYPLTPILAVLFIGAAVVSGDWTTALRTFLGGLAAFAAMLALGLISPGGMGMGDVKLSAMLGFGLAYQSWAHVPLGLFGGFLIGGVIAISLLAIGRKKRKDHIPFGPSLAAGTMVAILYGEPLIASYLRSLGLS